MNLLPFEKLVIIQFNERINVHVIGIKPEPDGTTTYVTETLRKDFLRSKSGSRLMRISSRDIENDSIKIEKHVI